MLGEDPFPFTIAVPFVGVLRRDQLRFDELVSSSVALSSLGVQLVCEFSVIVLRIGPEPCEISGGAGTGVLPCKLVIITRPCPELAPAVLFCSEPELNEPAPYCG